MAVKRLNLRTVLFDSAVASSLSKGESYLRTLETIYDLDPELVVVRYGGEPEIEQLLRKSSKPVINAGDGVKNHPTQALLDAFTIKEGVGEIKGKNVLIVGDIRHSRVATSNLQLLHQLEANVGFCAPPAFLPESIKADKYFEVLNKEALEWCDVCMCLRVQKERHSGTSLDFTWEDYKSKYFLDIEKSKLLKEEALIMHPGPVIGDLDMDLKILNDPRSRVRTQVVNGVFVRAALLSLLLGIVV
ncbi:MAG: aspartate carbamoyltransferase [Bdellovibrio sp.]|nr:MAG: aspartate carbamoyltransferase [Bdellovibrio sp.]